MTSLKTRTSSPLTLGKELQVFDETVTAAGSKTETFSIDAESVLISLYIGATSGDVDVSAFTVGRDGQEVEVITFPTISSPTSELLLRKAASALQRVKIVVSYTDACSFNIRARGVSAGAASVSIEGASNFKASQTDVTSTAGVLIASSLEDRKGILIINNNVGSSEILYLGGTLAQSTTVIGTPVRPGGNVSVNLSAGASLFAVSDGSDIDVRIAETGGS
jgi:hypothetical protein